MSELDPITDATADMVPKDDVAGLRKQLQCLTAALKERKEFKKNQVKDLNGQITDIQEQIDEVVTELELREKTL